MRIPTAAAALLLLAAPAFAQTPLTGTQGVGTQSKPPLSGTAAAPGSAAATVPAAPQATGSGTMPLATSTPSTTGTRSATSSKRMTMPERFRAANTSHDGHLTLAQAQAANWQRVVKNYAAIDTQHRGYVTLDEIHAYNQAQYRAHHKAKAAASQG